MIVNYENKKYEGKADEHDKKPYHHDMVNVFVEDAQKLRLLY